MIRLAYVEKKQYLCTRKGFNTMTTQNQMFNFTPPPYGHVAYGRLVSKNIDFRNA